MRDLSDAVEEFENDPQIGTLILTGQGKAFAAGGWWCIYYPCGILGPNKGFLGMEFNNDMFFI
jgi:hypothetical protein